MGIRFATIIAAGAVCGACGNNKPVTPAPPIVLTDIATHIEPAPQTEPLLNYVTRSIDASKPHISAGRKDVVAHMVAHIAETVFQDRKQQEFWVALIGVESRYESTAKSVAGAVGLGQLIPAYVNDFGKDCGIGELSKQDVADDYTNLWLSACHFRSLVTSNDGNLPIALVAYNAGSNSASTAAAKQGGKIAQESDAYTRKVWVKHEQATKK